MACAYQLFDACAVTHFFLSLLRQEQVYNADNLVIEGSRRRLYCVRSGTASRRICSYNSLLGACTITPALMECPLVNDLPQAHCKLDVDMEDLKRDFDSRAFTRCGRFGYGRFGPSCVLPVVKSGCASLCSLLDN